MPAFGANRKVRAGRSQQPATGERVIRSNADDTGERGNMTEKLESLDDILENREPPAAEAPEAAVEEPEPQEAPEELSARKEAREKLNEDESPGQPRDEHGRFAPKGEKPETAEGAPPAPQDEPGHIPVAALKDERSKRQALEAELAQLRAQMAQPQQQMPPQEQGPPDRWEDPEGYDRWLIGQASALAEERAIHAVQTQRIYSSAVRARAKYADYGEAHAVFGEMVQRNPSLFQSMVQADDPAEFAYNEARTEMAIRQAGGLQGYIQQEAARLAAEQANQNQQNFASVQDKLPSAPPSISSDRSVGSRSGPQWSGPPSLDELLR